MPDEVAFKNESSMVVVLTSAGYPESYPKGETLLIPGEIPAGSEIIHAGTLKNEEGEIVTAGGRVLGAVGTGETLAMAKEKAYALCSLVEFPSKFFRNDIGHREFSRTL
jgi:phosphoribosylamine-glycine ligase